MRNTLLILLGLLACIAIGVRFLPRQNLESLILKFEDDEGNYRDNYAEPGVGYLTLTVTRLPDGRFRVEGEGPVALTEVPALVRSTLRTRLKSYDPRTGRIHDQGTGTERGGDEFVGVDTRLVEDLRQWRDSGRWPEASAEGLSIKRQSIPNR